MTDGVQTGRSPALPGKLPVPLEAGVYEAVVALLTLAGCKVYRLSQVRASRQSPGIPDLYVFGPTTGAWFEVKRPGGRLRPEQREFRERCEARRIEHVVGGVDEAKRLLLRWGCATVENDGQFVLTPKRKAG